MPAFCFLFCVCENFNICYYQLPYYFMVITLIILVLSAVFFMSGKVRSDLVALCALISLLFFQILTPEAALSGFSNSVVIMMVGLFVVGCAFWVGGGCYLPLPKRLLVVFCLSRSFPSSLAFDMFGK